MFSIVTAWDPVAKAPAFFLQRSLHFGAAAAVLAFNWVATALHAILAVLFYLGLTNFYDDFVVVERLALADSAQEVFEGIFELIGWTLKPLPGFAQRFEPLGVVVDLADAVGSENDDCQVRVSNQQKRVEQLVADFDGILRDDSLHFGVCATAASVRRP